MRDENREPIYAYNDEDMRHFVRQSIKRRRCSAFSQNCKSTISDQKFIIISKELNVNGNIYEFVEIYFEHTNKHRKVKDNEYDSQFDDY